MRVYFRHTFCDIAVGTVEDNGHDADLLAVKFGPDTAIELIALEIVRDNVLGTGGGT